MTKGVGRRLFIYGGGIVNGVVIGTVVYASRHPDFKKTADSHVPGFGLLVDQSTSVSHSVERVVREWWRSLKIYTPERSENVGLQPVYKKPTEKQTESKQVPTTTQPPTEAAPNIKPHPPTDKEEAGARPAENKQPAPAAIQPTLETKTPPTSDKEEERKIEEGNQAIDTSPKSPLESSKEEKLPAQAAESETAKLKSKSVEDEAKSGKPLTTKTEEEERGRDAGDELEQAYQVFALESDSLLASQHQLAHAISTHHLQLLEASKTPQSKQQQEIIAGELLCFYVL